MKSTSLKLFFTLASIFATVSFAQANTVETKNIWLKLEMKRMQSALKSISNTISDPSMNASNASLADSYVQITTSAKAHLPDEIAHLPASEQAARKALYEEMMDQSIEEAQILADALRKNDQAKAKRMLAQLKKGKTSGHKEFSADDKIQPEVAQEYIDAMKAMGIDLKLIQGQVNDPSQNAASAKLADDFIKKAILSKTFVPDSIAKLPSSEQPARMDLYNKMNDECIDFGRKLLKALQTNDNAGAAQLLKNLAKNKKDSHFEFK